MVGGTAVARKPVRRRLLQDCAAHGTFASPSGEKIMQFRVGPVVLIVVGVLFLLSNLGLLDLHHLFRQVGTWWPLILIVLGIASLAGGKKR